MIQLLRLLEPIAGLQGMLFLTLTGGALLLLAGRLRRLARALLALGVLLFLALVLLPLDAWLLRPLETRFARPASDVSEPVAGIVLLGGLLDMKLSAVHDAPQLNTAAARLTTFAALAIRHPEARLIISSGARAAPGGISEARRLATLLVDLGLPRERLAIEENSRNTRENALESMRLAQPAAGERWLLVTSAWHMPRAIGVFRAIGWPVEAQPADYLAGGHWEPSLRFGWRLLRSDTALREWIALLSYRYASWTPSLLPGP